MPTDRSDNEFAVSARVVASPGCFEWFSSDSGLVNVRTGLDSQCEGGRSGSAIITVMSNITGSCGITAIGSMEEPLTVDVHTGAVERIEILTTVRRLALFEQRRSICIFA